MDFTEFKFYKKVLGRVFVIMLLFTLLVFLMDKKLMPLYTNNKKIVLVPDVTGLTFSEAEKKMSEESLEARMGYGYFDPKLPIGAVLSQNPFPNSKVKEGRNIYLSLNVDRKSPTTVPNLKYQTLKKAKKMLKRAQLDLGDVSEEVTEKLEYEGKILWQSILPKRKVQKETKIHVKVARISLENGKKLLSLPAVEAMSLENAKELLKKAGFEKIVIKDVVSKSITPNTVIEQNPKEGQIIKANQTIILKVSVEKK